MSETQVLISGYNRIERPCVRLSVSSAMRRGIAAGDFGVTVEAEFIVGVHDIVVPAKNREPPKAFHLDEF